MHNRLTSALTVFSLGLALASATSAQSSFRLLAPADHDLAPTRLLAPIAGKALATTAREPVAVSRALDSSQALELEARPFVARSREYWVDVSAEELRQGVSIYTESPGALVRLNPSPGLEKVAASRAAIDPAALVLVGADGRIWSDGQGMEQLITAEKLAQTELPFAAGTSVFRLRSELGSGKLELRLASAPASASYVMHVLDATSDVELTLTTSHTDYLHGQTLEIEAAVVRGVERLEVKRFEGFVTSPGGRAWPVEFHRFQPGLYRATLELDALEPPTPGLWEAHALAYGRAGKKVLRRNARTSFACAVPVARLRGDLELRRSGSLVFALEVAADGRYEVRGTLYGTAADGSLRPSGLAQTAAWLESGEGELELIFSPETLRSTQLGAPYELRDLRLYDQSRMGVLHRQARAFILERNF